MARPTNPGLTDNELLVMKALWDESPLTVADVIERLNRKPKPAYTSVLTLMQAMEKKGYIEHSKAGKAYCYEPLLDQRRYEKSELTRTAKRLYGGDPLKLAINLVKDEHLSDAEILELKKILEDL